MLDCRSNLSGANYGGTLSQTRSGHRCQRWDTQMPHRHNVTADMLPEATLREARNYCRSPDYDRGGPWCFAEEPDVEWEYCDVPRCGECWY